MLVLIAVCKRRCHPKFTLGGAETGASAGEGEEEEPEYETIDISYMNVGAIGAYHLELQQNEAYATRLNKI